MSKFGKCGEYKGFPCPNCGRYRLIHYSKGFDICEKCDWCVQLNRYVDAEEFVEKCDDCAKYQECGAPDHAACGEFEPKERDGIG